MTVFDLSNVPLSQLVSELTRRKALPRCRCGRWSTYLGAWDAHGYTLRCRGCLKVVAECVCS